MLGLGLHSLAGPWPRAGGGQVDEVEWAGPTETYAGAGARLGGHFEGVESQRSQKPNVDPEPAAVSGAALGAGQLQCQLQLLAIIAKSTPSQAKSGKSSAREPAAVTSQG
eukprot:7355600-Prymnesium_polylepis.1